MSNENEKTHYRKAFNSPYLSSADIVAPTNLTISHVTYANDATKKTKDKFNTAHFVEKEIRKGEKLKPMILNATNCKTLKSLTSTPYLEDWVNVPVTIYVDTNVKNRGKTVEGLRISPVPPVTQKPVLTKADTETWNNAIQSFKATGNLNQVLEHVQMSEADANLLIQEAQNV
jgi:hypothetical protein